jgi:hypothetical protein
VTLAERADPRVLRGPLERPRRGTGGAGTPDDERTRDDEQRSIAGLVESLVTAFPGVPEPQVRACVEDITAGFASARIRTYVPIFIARRARAALTVWPAQADGPHPA